MEPQTTRDVPLGYLRTFLTLLVVAHHSALAYYAFAPAPAASLKELPMMWTAFPVVDPQKWPAAALFIGFNDTFFMSLMFLISGVFVWPALLRKGSVGFLRARLIKLGIPFAIAAAVLSPLAYYPSYFATGADPALGSFMKEWVTLGVWPAGPAWFLWVLIAFGVVAAAASKIAPGLDLRAARAQETLSESPMRYALALIAISALVYLPMAAAFTPENWSNVGPFWFQTSRLLHYAVYFVAGMGLGAQGLGRGLLAHGGKLARRWPLWIMASMAAFVLGMVALFTILKTYGNGGTGPSMTLSALGNLTFVLSCATSSLACLAVFVRFARETHPILDHLSANAYGIYLFHYVCVSWLQMALLGTTSLPGGLKAMTVFVGTVALSWMLASTLRRIPAVARVL